MILEHAILEVSPEQVGEFEHALGLALSLIRATPGFIRLEVRPAVDRKGRYLLLVQWQRLEDHTIGFRQSDRYRQWSALLHRFYKPFPEVTYFGDPLVQVEETHFMPATTR
jgi:heme-degrading monooxygenase HmoA